MLRVEKVRARHRIELLRWIRCRGGGDAAVGGDEHRVVVEGRADVSRYHRLVDDAELQQGHGREAVSCQVLVVCVARQVDDVREARVGVVVAARDLVGNHHRARRGWRGQLRLVERCDVVREVQGAGLVDVAGRRYVVCNHAELRVPLVVADLQEPVTGVGEVFASRAGRGRRVRAVLEVASDTRLVAGAAGDDFGDAVLRRGRGARAWVRTALDARLDLDGGNALRSGVVVDPRLALIRFDRRALRE